MGASPLLPLLPPRALQSPTAVQGMLRASAAAMTPSPNRGVLRAWDRGLQIGGVKTNQGCENKGSSRWERSAGRAPHPVAVPGTLPGCRPGIRCEWGIWGVCTSSLTWASANPLIALIMEVNPLCRQQAGQGCGEEVGSGLGEVGSAPTRMPMGFCSYVGVWEQANCVEVSIYRGQCV